MRPGSLDAYARRVRLASALITLDLPALERPAKATSGVEASREDPNPAMSAMEST